MVMSWSLPGSWEYLSLNSLSCSLSWKRWNWKKCAKLQIQVCHHLLFSYLLLLTEQLRFVWHIRQVNHQVTARQHGKPDCSPLGLGIPVCTKCRWCVRNRTANWNASFTSLPLDFFLYADCSGKHTSVRDVCCTSCGPGTGIRCDESLLLWQQRGRKNSLQLCNPFQKQQLERQNANKKRENLQGRSFPCLSYFPLFVYVFPLLSVLFFYSYLNPRCF